VQGITASLPTLIPAAVTALIGLVGALIDNLPLLIDAGIQLVIGLAIGLIEALPQLIEKIPELIVGIVTAIVGAIPQLVVAGVQLFLALIQNLPAIISGIVGSTPLIIEGLVKAFTSPKFLGDLANAGVALIQGFIDGITSMIGAVGDAVGGVMDFVAGFFPHSPADRGPFSGSGWADLRQSGLAIADQFNSGIQAGFDRDVLGGLTANLASQSVGLSLATTARATAQTNAFEAFPADNGDGFEMIAAQNSLLKRMLERLDNMEPGLVFSETVARSAQAGGSRLSALGAT
jgi:hypothetical protein